MFHNCVIRREKIKRRILSNMPRAQCFLRNYYHVLRLQLVQSILTCKSSCGIPTLLHSFPKFLASWGSKVLCTCPDPTFHSLGFDSPLLPTGKTTTPNNLSDFTTRRRTTPKLLFRMSDPTAQTVPSGAPAAAPAQTAAPAAPGPALTPAQKKAQAKAEKAARRGQVVAAKVVPPTPNTPAAKAPKKTTVAAGGPTPVPTAAQKAKGPKIPDMYSHLSTAKKLPLSKADKDVHPSVLAIGQQMANFTLKDNSARLEAMLVAFMKVSQRRPIPDFSYAIT